MSMLSCSSVSVILQVIVQSVRQSRPVVSLLGSCVISAELASRGGANSQRIVRLHRAKAAAR